MLVSYVNLNESVHCILLTSDKHDADGENLFGVGVGRDVAKTDAGERGEGEVESCYVAGFDRWTAQRVVVIELLSVVSQGIQPPYPRMKN